MSLRRCFFLFRQRISPFCPFSSKAAAKAEQDYPEILPTRKWGTAQDIPGVAVMSYRREELKTNDPWNIKPSRRKPTLRDYFFFPSPTRARSKIISNTIATRIWWQPFQLSNLFR